MITHRLGVFCNNLHVEQRMFVWRYVDGEIRLNEWGHVVEDCWEWLDKQYAFELDTWINMPNHLHRIIVITDDKYSRGGSRTAPTSELAGRATPTKYKPLGP